MNPRPARAIAAIGDIELVAIAPGSALIHIFALIVHVAAGKIVLYELGDGAALDKGRQDLDRQAQIAGYTGYIGLGTGGLHEKSVTTVNRLAVDGGDANPHTRGHEQAIAIVLPKFESHT
jgi:hypothetical protein